MKRNLIQLFLVAFIVGGGWCGCSRSHSDNGDTAQGNDQKSDSGPRHWKPTAEAIENARRQTKTPLIVASINPPRASAYDLNPRAAEQASAQGNGEAQTSSEQAAAPADSDPALGEMEKLPPPPMPPKLASGDEADQFGLPEWERMARGELHVKRIRY